MGLQIGRFGSDDTSAVNVVSWSVSGDEITIDGNIRASSEAALLKIRDQGFGLLDLQEPWVPVLWGQDATLNGYCRPVDFSAEHLQKLTHDGDGAASPTFLMGYTAKLQRFPQGRTTVDTELLCRGGLRTNSHTITNTQTRPFVGVPDAAVGFAPSYPGRQDTVIAAGDSTNVRHVDHGTSANRNQLWDERVRNLIDPTDYYNGACSIEVSNSTIVGLNAPHDPDGWGMSNQLMRIQVGANPGELDCQWYDGSGWDQIDFIFTKGTGPTNLEYDPYAMTILRNCADVVAIRLAYYDTSSRRRYTVDLMLRRGARYVEGYMLALADTTLKWGVARTSTEAATAVTGGIRATNNDNGHRYVLCLPADTTNDLTNGAVRRTNANVANSFMIGCEVGGTSAVDPFTAQTLIHSYMSTVGVSATAVAQ